MRIAIVKLSALGDIVHAMVVLQFIKKLNKEITIDWIVEKHYQELLNFHPHINQVIAINLRRAKSNKSLIIFFNELKRFRKLNSYDLVIDLQGLIKSAIISRIIPSKNTIGFDKNSAREGLASFFYSKKFEIIYGENVVKRNFELVKFALDMPFEISMLHQKASFVFSSQRYKNSSLSISKKNVVLVPGASQKTKIYPVNKIAELTNLLDANFIVIWGNNSERFLAEEIKKISPKVKIANKLSLDELISLISQVDLVIGSDTGPTHLAWASNIPSITLFGSTPGYRNTISSSVNHIIESKSDVNPYKLNKHDFSIQEIEVNEIFQVASSLLDSKKSS
jgi:heptosyltransferase I